MIFVSLGRSGVGGEERRRKKSMNLGVSGVG